MGDKGVEVIIAIQVTQMDVRTIGVTRQGLAAVRKRSETILNHNRDQFPREIIDILGIGHLITGHGELTAIRSMLISLKHKGVTTDRAAVDPLIEQHRYRLIERHVHGGVGRRGIAHY